MSSSDAGDNATDLPVSEEAPAAAAPAVTNAAAAEEEGGSGGGVQEGGREEGEEAAAAPPSRQEEQQPQQQQQQPPLTAQSWASSSSYPPSTPGDKMGRLEEGKEGLAALAPLPSPPRPHRPPSPAGAATADDAASGQQQQLSGGVGGEEEEEELMDEAHELALLREFGGHPLVSRVQAALFEQIHKTLVRLDAEHRELAEDLKRTKDKREVVGVELYGQQQQLARLQLTLESTHDGLNNAAQDRTRIEEDIRRLKGVFKARTDELADKTKQLHTNHTELEALRETLRQVEQYNEEMKNEISITRRATYKVEEALQQLEGHKKGQDLYIDSLSQQVKRRAEQLQAYEAQKEVQKHETERADTVLRETTKEMEMLRFEKKQLMLHWKSSLVGLTRRDEALASALEALREAQLSAKDYDMEIDGIKREILKQQARNETLVAVRDRLESETKYVDDQMGKLHTDRQAVADKFAILERSKEEAVMEEQRLQQTAQHLREQIQGVAHNLQVVTKERQALEQEVEANINTQSTVSKAVRNLNKAASAVTKRVHSKEIEIANVQNELARVQVDKLDTDAHVTQLRSTLEQLDQDLKVKDQLIEKYELEIRQRNDDIEKKMYRVDRLNKKYQQLMAAYDDEEPEAMGPLEATIKHVKKETEALEDDCRDMQKEWLDKQTRLVKCLSQSESQTEKVSELRARVVILQQQQARLVQEGQVNGDKTAALEAVTSAMHKDIARMNEFIGKASRQCSELSNENFVREKEFVEELKRLEHESAEAERKLRSVLDQKAQVLDEILETERQAMLWEKKIELEKETQAALDPEAGQGEVRAMEREIHRMQIRLETLKREQERYLVEMERAIYKHEVIAISRNNNKAISSARTAPPQGRRPNGGAGGGEVASSMSNVALRKRVKSLHNGLRSASKESGELALSLEDKTIKLHALTGDLDKETCKYDELERACQSLQGEINGLLYHKQKQTSALARTNTLIKYFQRVASLPVLESAAQVSSEYQHARQALSDVGSVIKTLQAQYPHLSQVLDRVLDLAANAVNEGDDGGVGAVAASAD